MRESTRIGCMAAAASLLLSACSGEKSSGGETPLPGTGLEAAGRTLQLATPYQLPQGCGAAERPAWDPAGERWFCAPAAAVEAGIGLERDGAALALAPDYRLPSGCEGGALPRWNGSGWSCSFDVDTNTDTLAALECAAGQVPSWSGTGWSCVAPEANTDTLAALACSEGQVPAWIGQAWTCAPKGTITGVAAGAGLQGGGEAGVASLGLDLAFTDTRYQRRSGRTVVVSPGADPQASGAALLAAVAGLEPVESAPVLLRLEPGTYDIGGAVLDLPPWVSMEGAGPKATVVQGAGTSVIRVGLGETRTELRAFAILHAPVGFGRTISSRGRELRLVDVEVNTHAVQGAIAVDASRAHPTSQPAEPSRLLLRGTHIRVGGQSVPGGAGAQSTYGVEGDDVTVQLSSIAAAGLTGAEGVVANFTLDLVASEVLASCAPFGNCTVIGVRLDGYEGRIRASSAIARGGGIAVGVHGNGHAYLTSRLRIDASHLGAIEAGTAHAVMGSSPVWIATSMLEGGRADGDVRCTSSHTAAFDSLSLSCR